MSVMIVERLMVGPLQANCFIVSCEETQEALVIDPGGEAERIAAQVKRLGVELKAIVGTHAHLDHVLGVRDLQGLTGAPFLLHKREEPALSALQEWTRLWLGYDPGPPPAVDGYLESSTQLSFGNCTLEVRLTPGHSPGGVSLIDHGDRKVFVGDLLFRGSVGRSDLPGGDHAALIKSVEDTIFPLGDDFTVLPGHGPMTTVGHERRTNPFFRGTTQSLSV